MDSFPQYTGTAGPPPAGQSTNGLVMGYYDGNTVTALWNYAQRFALNDNSYDTTFAPSSGPLPNHGSTANPKHLRPSSTKMIGVDGDQANHQYDINDFYSAVEAGNFPAVSFLKAQ